MEREFLLDTNAFYNLLAAMNPEASEQDTLVDSIATLKKEKLFVSSITEVEIISVLGKYARGVQGGFSKCNCQVSPEGHICQNSRYTAPQKNGEKSVLKHGANLLVIFLKENQIFLPWASSHSIQRRSQRPKK